MNLPKCIQHLLMECVLIYACRSRLRLGIRIIHIRGATLVCAKWRYSIPVCGCNRPHIGKPICMGIIGDQLRLGEGYRGLSFVFECQLFPYFRGIKYEGIAWM